MDEYSFENFESAIWGMGFGIVAMNHYTLNFGGVKPRHLYCVVLERTECGKGRAFKAEGQKSSRVFANIIKQILDSNDAIRIANEAKEQQTRNS